MSEAAEVQATEQQTEEQAATQQNASENDPQAANAPAEGTDQQDASEGATSPLWEGIAEDHPLRNEVRSLRDEAAARRKEVQRERQAKEDLQAKLSTAKSEEEFQVAVADYTRQLEQAQTETLRERVARRFSLPDALADRLRGSTEEELTTDAEALKGFITPAAPPTPQNPPAGGLTPKVKAQDPASIAAQIRATRW